MRRISKTIGLLLLLQVSYASQAAIVVNFALNVRDFNPGPFSTTADMTASFEIDDSVVPTGTAPVVWAGALDNFTVLIADPALGNLTFTATDGQYRQLVLPGGESSLSGAVNPAGAQGGTFPVPLSFVNPALSPGPFVLERFAFEFRMLNPLPDNGQVARGLSITDFGFLDFNLTFSHPTAPLGQRVNINRAGEFTSLNFSGNAAVPAPVTSLLLASGLLLLRRKI